MENRERPIGIFDSGIGGLTVLREILREIPRESTIYLGDTARVPYGIRSPETVLRYSFETTRFLYSKNIKVLVIACNTASSVSLDAIKNALPIPVIGVINPGAEAAVAATQNKRIGVIGTAATVRSDAYTKAIRAIDNTIEVYSLACPLFVPLVEEGWTEGKIVEMIAEKYLDAIRDKGIDTLVLGCTHYPLLKGVLSKVMGGRVRLIDSAIETARELRTILCNASLERIDRGNVHEFYVTDDPDKFIGVGEKFLDRKIDTIRKIELETEE